MFKKNRNGIYQFGRRMLSAEFVLSTLAFIVVPFAFGLKKMTNPVVYPYGDYNSFVTDNSYYNYHNDGVSSFLTYLKTFLNRFPLSLVNVATVLLFLIRKGEWDWPQKVLASSVLPLEFLYLGWYCFGADRLNEEMEGMNQLIFQDQASHEKILKNFYLILSPRFMYRERISAMRIFNLSREGFGEVISASFSLLATFSQLRNRLFR